MGELATIVIEEAEPDWREIAWSLGRVNKVLSPWVVLRSDEHLLQPVLPKGVSFCDLDAGMDFQPQISQMNTDKHPCTRLNEFCTKT